MSGHTLITGGAGFIGTNLADAVASDGGRVVLLDNLSRRGVEENARFICERHGSRVDLVEADVCDARAVARAVRGASRVFHLAAQVAVTTSLEDPLGDAATNMQGTLNLLEALRARPAPPPVVFTSTNKVYGALGDVTLVRRGSRYEPADVRLRRRGIGEDRPLSFCTPYGCSKGAADQYLLDYASSYGVPGMVFRMSCIYGTHQMGNEDQGWVAHFLIRALEREPITIYGDGCQVRDVLYVDDLVDALLRAAGAAQELAGRAFNIGGGPANSVSLLEVIDLIERLHDSAPAVEFGPWRQGDQRYYVSDTSAFEKASGWRPTVSASDGLARLNDWLSRRRVTPAAAAAA